MKFTISDGNDKQWRNRFAWFPKLLKLEPGKSEWIWLERYRERLVDVRMYEQGQAVDWERSCRNTSFIVTKYYCG